MDGQLITQAKAAAGNVTPGDTPGFPVTLSRPGLYKLASNLSIPTGRIGIEPTVADVTIDLNGYRVHGFGRANTTGIRSTEPSITVRNGTIAGLTCGVCASGSTLIFEDLRVVVNGTGIDAGNSDRTIIRNSEVASNDRGIRCRVSCLVQDNIISSNGITGISIRSGFITGNSIFNNGAAIVNLSPLNDVGSNGNVVLSNNNNTIPGSFLSNYCGASPCAPQ